MSQNLFFFGTCLLDISAPKAGLAAIKMLERIGYSVRYPKNQSCCSQPAFNAGYRDEARKVATAQIDAFPGEDPIIVPSGSCGAMMKKHYHELFKDHPLQEHADAFSARIHEWSRFLVDNDVDWIDNGKPARVAVHHSCHAQREMDCGDSQEVLLGRLTGVEVVPIEDANVCCGFGGTFSVKFEEISGLMLKNKMQSVLNADVDYLVSADYGCLSHIGGGMTKAGGDDVDKQIKVRHIAEFIWDRIA